MTAAITTKREAAALQASLLSNCTADASTKYPVLNALFRVVQTLPKWNDRDAASVLLRAAAPETRKLTLPGEWGVGRALWEPFPTPGERLADAPLWVETTSHIVGFRSAPPQGVRTGILFARVREPAWPDLVCARFVVAHTGMLPFVVPGACLIDVGAHDQTRLAYADFLREREGLKVTRKASRAELLQMYETVRMLDEGMIIACLRGKGAVNLRADVDPYHPIKDYGTEGLRAAFASTVVVPAQSALTLATTLEANTARMLSEYLIRRGPHAALSALRLAVFAETGR